MSPPVFDLHCDLPAYLARHPNYTAYDFGLACSIPQMKRGGVKEQILAIFADKRPSDFDETLKQLLSAKRVIEGCTAIEFHIAIENAEALLDEQTDLHFLEKRLQFIIEHVGRPKYVSLTWNGESFFGGGVGSSIGLKSEGLLLVKLLDKYRIPIDISHASDPLIDDLIIAKETLQLSTPLIASHSNLRTIHPHARNLSQTHAEYLIHNKGLIGLNFITFFLGNTIESLLDHITEVMALGGEDCLAFGGDFFDPDSTIPLQDEGPFYFPHYDNASIYPNLYAMIEQTFGPRITEKLYYKNAANFFANPLLKNPNLDRINRKTVPS